MGTLGDKHLNWVRDILVHTDIHPAADTSEVVHTVLVAQPEQADFADIPAVEDMIVVAHT